MTRRSAVAMLAAMLLVFALVPIAPAAAPSPNASSLDSGSAIVQLSGAPLSTSPRTRPAKAKKINFKSASVKAERAALKAVRNDFRRWLKVNAPKARVTSEMDIAVHAVGVKLNGTTLATIRKAPMVRHAEFQAIFRSLAHEDPDLDLINANEAWTAVGGAANAGAGVKVAVIDSGIDASHPCFDDAGYAPQQQLGDTSLTNNKVIVAKVFNNNLKKLGADASAVDSHGTHVAGTIACNAHTPASIGGVDIPYDPSGVAPRALLGNYNVFPGDTGSARSEDILNAMDEAYEDGFDVANMSLGGARNDGGGAFLLDNAIDNLDRANMVVAVAAGNEGPGYFTVHYPGAAPRALTAGASTVGHAIINIVTVDGTDYEAVVGDFAKPTADISGPLAVVAGSSVYPHHVNLACDAPFETLPAGTNLTGKIALLGRGDCDFTVKVRNAQNAGAIGVIMVNRVAGEAPFLMSHNGLEPQPTIPAVMVSLEDGAAIDDHAGDTATIHALGEYVTTPEDTNLMAGFSSQGPTHGDLLIKPDVVAPGADIISSFPQHHCDPLPPEGCWSFLGGTSMATPHLAGTAAVVRGDHRDWTAAQVRSAVVNTAQQGVLRHPETGVVTNDAQIVGAGLVDVAAAVDAVAALAPVSTSFGNLSSGSGGSRSSSVVITNISDASKTFTVSVSDTANDGVTFSTTGGSVTLAPGASATFRVTAVGTKKSADGHKQATLRVSAGGKEVAHAMLYVLVGEGERAPGRHMLPPPKA
ncbi:MAG TPA: S8 family serine peptidase [Methylomirabilota bacterium]|nr:S8 family serine peptidase [Methylomirabilota bacterium]